MELGSSAIRKALFVQAERKGLNVPRKTEMNDDGERWRHDERRQRKVRV